MPVAVETAAVAGVERVGERLWLLHLDAPQVAPLAGPGQSVLVRCADADYPHFDPFLPRAYYVLAADKEAGRLSLLVERRGRGSAFLCARREGDGLVVTGPICRAMATARLTRHALVLAEGLVGAASLVFVANEAARRGCAVTFVVNSENSTVLPIHLLRSDVELRAATPESGGLLGALPGLLPWADEVFVAAPLPLLETLSALRRQRLAPFTLHAGIPVVALPLPAPGVAGVPAGAGGGDLLPCGTGVCGACRVTTRSGPRLLCEDGPAFPLEALRFPDEPDGGPGDDGV